MPASCALSFSFATVALNQVKPGVPICYLPLIIASILCLFITQCDKSPQPSLSKPAYLLLSPAIRSLSFPYSSSLSLTFLSVCFYVSLYFFCPEASNGQIF
ncbi:hypothetical protein BsWGS_08030 [Bradybaena similaris]